MNKKLEYLLTQKEVRLDKEAFAKLIEYLQNRPHIEVAELMDSLTYIYEENLLINNLKTFETPQYARNTRPTGSTA